MLPYLENHVFLKTLHVEKLTKYVDLKIEVAI